jgi:hypothetical protein
MGGHRSNDGMAWQSARGAAPQEGHDILYGIVPVTAVVPLAVSS